MSVRITAAFVVIFLIGSVMQDAQAQFDKRWLAVGSLANEHAEVGGIRVIGGAVGLAEPHWYPYRDHFRNDGVWIGAKNVEDENGEVWPLRIAHIGNRFTGEGEYFPQVFETISRFEPPQVTVDGLQSFRYLTNNDRVDPDLKADRMIHIVVNSLIGIEMDQKIYQFSNEYHDNYHIQEMTFTNTGNIDADPEIENPDATLDSVYFYMGHQYNMSPPEAQGVSSRQGGGGAGWGRDQMNDYVGDSMEDYTVDFRAHYSWAGSKPGFRGWDDIGVPVLTDAPSVIAEGDTIGRLSANKFAGRLYMHVDEEAHTLPEEERSTYHPKVKPFEQMPDDPTQPSTSLYYNGNHELFGCHPCAWNIETMREEWDHFVTRGHMYPHHADIIAGGPPWEWSRDKMARQKDAPHKAPPFGTAGGGANVGESHGPFTLEPGESVRIVTAVAVDGLDRNASIEIGKAYKRAWQQEIPNASVEYDIEYDANGDGEIGPDEKMPKNHWVMTGRDSLFKTYERAIANMESGYEIARPPRPPREFHVTSGPDQITLEWQPYDGHTPQQWEIYRAAERRSNIPEHVATVEGSRTIYEDSEVIRGIGYYYYVKAVGDVNEDPTGLTPTGQPLKSNRAYTQTYDPASLKRPPGDELEEAVVVPNPYHLGSSSNVRWPDKQDRIAFLDIPGDCTIKIFTEKGELVETIRHDDGSGDDFWDLTTSSNQVVVSGLYMAVIEDHTTGEQLIRKFTIIR